MELANNGFRICVDQDAGALVFSLVDLQMGFDLADAPYRYHAVRQVSAGEARLCTSLQDASVQIERDRLRVTGSLAGLTVLHELWLPEDEWFLEERITLRNPESVPVALTDFACGWQRRITNEVGRLRPDLSADRLVAIPFRHSADAPAGTDNDYTFAQIATGSGREVRINEVASVAWGNGYVRSARYFSEGWAWARERHSLGIFKFNQQAIEFSVLDTCTDARGTMLCFGGSGLRDGEPSALTSIAPGATVALGVTRYETTIGGYVESAYACRQFLDANGCRFPDQFDPPVHWNELYDNAEYSLATAGNPPQPRKTRHLTYTREAMLEEAAKARAYHCEALYLDPGWDTEFGSFIWGEAWLGERRAFVETVRDTYGLKLSLHCPLATWLSFDQNGVGSWPLAAQATDASGHPIYCEHRDIHRWRLVSGQPDGEGAPFICLGSRQYLDEAERRLLENCDDGVTFLMFDGNWYGTDCHNPEHGHSVPYTRADHVAANLDLAQRVHARYPDVLIEMHDMVVGGSALRYTPVYYKYGLPGSYDINWGFELMWQPMEDLLSGRALALYYYNLACNVPIYLHVDLRGDNEHALVLWWYASTCRHLGIGGSHENPLIAETHRMAMKRYQKLARFFKRGDFYGPNEEVHFHILPEESAFVAVVFNLSDTSRVVSGTLDFAQAGLDRDRWYDCPIVHETGGFDAERGTFTVARRLAAWSAQVVECFPLPTR